MAYYQAEDRTVPRTAYSSLPLDRFEESSPVRSRGPVLFLLFCVAAIATVWTIASASNSNGNTSLSIRAEKETATYMAALNLARSMQGDGAETEEQGLEDVEDGEEDDAPVDFDTSHFMACLERSCSPCMYAVAAANPSGSELLQCLSSSPDGVTATTCWAPESDDANDPEQKVRICAVCNGCIPGSVGPNDCNSGFGADANNGAPTNTPVVINPDLDPASPLGRYQADLPQREKVPNTNTSDSKRSAGKPWVHWMSGGRQNASELPAPALNFDSSATTLLFASKDKPVHHATSHKLREKDKTVGKKHSSKPTPALEPFWEKFVPGATGASGATSASGAQSPWAKYMSGGSMGGGSMGGGSAGGSMGGGSVGTASSTKKGHHGVTAPPTNMWDKYMSGGGSSSGGMQGGAMMGASTPTTASKKHSSKKKHTAPTHTAPVTGNPWDKYMSMGGQSSGGATVAADTAAVKDTLELRVAGDKKKTPPPTNLWDKYTAGKSSGGSSGKVSNTGASGLSWGQSQAGPLKTSAAFATGDTQSVLADPSPHPRHAAHTSSHHVDDLPPDSKSKHRSTSPAHDPAKTPATKATTATTIATEKKQQHTLPLKQCYQTCDKQVRQAADTKQGHAVLRCLGLAHSKLEGEKCLGEEDPASPTNDLRTCLVCNNCVSGEVKDAAVVCKTMFSPTGRVPWFVGG